MSNVFTKKVFVDRPEAQKEKVSLKRYLGGFLLGFVLLIILGFVPSLVWLFVYLKKDY